MFVMAFTDDRSAFKLDQAVSHGSQCGIVSDDQNGNFFLSAGIL